LPASAVAASAFGTTRIWPMSMYGAEKSYFFRRSSVIVTEEAMMSLLPRLQPGEDAVPGGVL